MTMTSDESKKKHITDEDISAAYGRLKTHHKQIPLTKSEMKEALGAAVRDINRCTIAITTMFEQEELAEATFDSLRPGTGVLVEAKGVYGIVTAGHVLNEKDKSNRKEKNIRYHKNRCTIGVMPLANERTQASKQPYFRIRQRRCCAYGVYNEDDSGPDIAYIPLTPQEWDLMEQDGVRAWPTLEEPDPVMPPNTKEEILLDCCVGANYKATRTLEEAHPEICPAIVCQGLQTLELARDRIEDGDWDFTKLTLEGDERGGPTTAKPSLSPAQTLRDFLDHDWHKLQPREMLGGLSGTGLWSAPNPRHQERQHELAHKEAERDPFSCWTKPGGQAARAEKHQTNHFRGAGPTWASSDGRSRSSQSNDDTRQRSAPAFTALTLPETKRAEARHERHEGAKHRRDVCRLRPRGGTFDVAVAESIKGRINLLAHGGIAMCGGRDFDRLLVDNCVKVWLHERFNLPENLAANDGYKGLLRLAGWATERAKIELSSREEANVSLSETEARVRNLAGEETHRHSRCSLGHAPTGTVGRPPPRRV